MRSTDNFVKAALLVSDTQKAISDLLGVPIRMNFEFELNREVTPEYVVETVSLVSGVQLEDLKKDLRNQETVYARFVAYHILRTYLMMTHKAIGKMFGKDHTTVIHGLKTIEDEVTNLPLQQLKEKCVFKFLKNLNATYEDTV